MDERSKLDLPYGHFGHANYDLVGRTWSFGRILTVGEALRPVEDAKNPRTYSNSSQTWTPHDPPAEPPHKRYGAQIRSLVRRYPEFHTATGLLIPLLKVSEAVEAAVKNYDPLRGSLISFTHIRSATSHKHVSIAAYASSETGCDLRLASLLVEKRSLDDDPNSWLEVPSLSGEEISISLGQPIQQVKFGSSFGPGSTFLAVRLLDKISIFQPSAGAAISESDDGPSLRLDHLHSISADQKLNEIFADVSFNPWFAQQVAVAYCSGNWRVFEFASSKLERISRTWSCPVPDSKSDDEALTDGWTRIAWVKDLETLAVCTRTTLQLCSIAGQHALAGQHIDIQADGGGAPVWILDFMVLPSHESHICLVTSQHVVIYQIEDGTAIGPSCRLKSRIRHFRNAEDLSLRVTCWTESSTLRMLLYSNAYPWASTYSCNTPDIDQLLAEDPTVLTTPKGRFGVDDALKRDLHVQPARLVQKKGAVAIEETPATKLKESARFYVFNALGDDYSISEGIWQSFSLAGRETPKHTTGLSSRKGAVRSGSKLLKSSFVVDDDVLDTGSQFVHQSEPFARRTRRQLLQQDVSDPTINIELVTDALNNPNDASTDLKDVISDIDGALLGAVSATSIPLQTLTKFAKAEITAGDVEDASHIFEDIGNTRPNEENMDLGVVSDDPDLHNTLSDVSLPGITGLGEELSGASISSVYDSLISKWISSLAPQVPGRIRLAKVEIVRRVTADLVLASRMVRVQDGKRNIVKVEAKVEDEGEPSHHAWELPVRSSRLDSSQNITSSPPVFEDYQKIPLLPTPSPTATPSVTTAASHPASFAAPELFRLSRYTTFAKPSPSVLPRSLSNVLSHWKPGEDLDDYDWLHKSRHLSQRDEDDMDEEMTEKDRKRVQRRAERHIRRQRKEAAASQAQQLASSQAAEVFSASQPAIKVESQPFGVAGSSQSQGPSAFAASQVVPGRFGGRPPSRKRRKQGF